MVPWPDLATSQSGVVSTQQLLDIGLCHQSIARIVACGRLVRLSRGVYVLPGSTPSWIQDLWVAILRLGSGAVVSHRSAAALLKLDGVPAGVVEVSIPHDRKAVPVPGSIVHRLRGSRADVVLVDKLPVTDAAYTLTDLGIVVDLDTLERALETALRLGLTSVHSLESTLAGVRGHGRSGPAALVKVLDRRPDGAVPTESDAETLFAQLVRRAGLVEPERQVVLHIDGRVIRVDFAWWRVRLAIEVDGAATHSTPRALRRDLRRQNGIMFGWMILRFTWADIVLDPEYVILTLRDAWALLTTGPARAGIS